MAFDTKDKERKQADGGGSQPSAAGAAGRSWLLPLAAGVVLGVGATALVVSQRSQAPNAMMAESPLSAAQAQAPAREPEAPHPAPAHENAVPAEQAPPNAAPAQPSSPHPSAPAADAVKPPHPAPSEAAHADVARAAPAPSTAAPKAPPPSAAAPAQPAAAPPPAKVTTLKTPTTEEEKLAAAAVVTTPAENVMDEMIDDALAHPKAKGERAAAPPPAAVPLSPSRDDVVKAMGTLVPAIRGCAQGQSGLAPMTIVVKNDGHVESAALSGGPFQGTASGGCMEGVVRRAHFPRFQQASFRVQFPFAVQ